MGSEWGRASQYMRKCTNIFTIYEEVVSHIWLCTVAPDPSEFPNIWGKFYFLFYQCTVLACLHILFSLYKAPGKAQLSVKPQMHVNQGPGKPTKLNSSLHMIFRDINIERRTGEIKRSVVFRMGWFQSYELHIPYVLKYEGKHISQRQCCGSGSGSVGFICFWASRIRIHSISQRYGSFYHQAKIVRKHWFLLFCDFCIYDFR